MAQVEIRCPQCGHQFELSEVMTRDIEDHLQKEFAKKLEEEKSKIIKEAQQKAADDIGLELTDLRQALDERNKKLDEAQKAQLNLMKEKRELEDAKKEIELSVEKQISEQRKKIEEQALEKYNEEHRLKDLQKDQQINDLRKMLEETKRKMEQGSMERQGEAFENDLERVLTGTFPLDTIAPVPKGVRGADIVQRVINRNLQECGTLLWEAKTAKNWTDKWVDKLKADQRDMGAEIAVIVSEVLPKEVDNFGLYNGVWVTTPRSTLGLATALREQVIHFHFLKQSAVGKDAKMEALYNYLAGPEFRQKMEAIVEAFGSLNEQIESERKVMEKQWAMRKKQVDLIMKSTVGMYGDMKGIIGKTLPEIRQLSLESGDE